MSRDHGVSLRAGGIAALLAALLTGAPARPALAQSPGSDTTATPIDSTAVTPTLTAPPDSLPPRRLLSTDGAIRVYQERRPGEGKNGFWWEYDANADLTRLLDKDRRSRPLDKLTDAYGFEIAAPDSIAALRDSVTAVADSILASRIQLSTSFDPKLTSRYSEQKDSFDFNNSLTSPIPLSNRATVETTLQDTNSFNKSTRKVRDGQSLASTFNYHSKDWLTTSLSLNRSADRQRRDQTVESRSAGTSLTGKVVATEKNRFGDFVADAGLSGNRNTYTTQITDGQSDQFSPNWHANASRSFGAGGKIAADYTGHTDIGTRREKRSIPGVDELGNPIVTLQDTTASERNLGNKLDLNADGKLTQIWSYRLASSIGRERLQYIAQAESVAGRQETRRNSNDSYSAHLEGKPMGGLELLLDADRSRVEYAYAVVTDSFNETTTNEGKAEVRYEPWKASKLIVRLNRSRENRNYRSAQRGFVDREAADLNWNETLTSKITLTGDYNIGLDSYVFADKVANTGDRDLRSQRGVVNVQYTPLAALATAARFDLRHDETINVDPQLSRDNKSDYTYVFTPSYTLTVGPTSLTGEFSATAQYSVYDFDEEKNFLTRTFATRQRLQRSLTEHVSAELVGTYTIQDEGSYQRGVAGGNRLFARRRETRREMVETQVLYSPQKWLRTSAKYHLDGEDDFSINEGARTGTGTFRTHELDFGVTVNKQFMRSIRVDLDATHGQKLGDRVTDVDRRFYSITASIEYQPFAAEPPPAGGSS
ncbi:MAG: hypothetical protein U0167_11265 [bacterium]